MIVSCLIVFRVPIVPLTSCDVCCICCLFVDPLIVCACGQDCSRAVSIRDDRLYWSVVAILQLLTYTLSLLSATLRALYLSDNDFETLPPDIGKLAKLQIVSNLSKFPLKSIAFVAALCAVCVGFILCVVCSLSDTVWGDLQADLHFCACSDQTQGCSW